MKEIKRIVSFYEQLKLENISVCLVSLVNIAESSYRRIGARMLVTETGEWIGGISGGCLEGDALIKAQKTIRNSEASIAVYDTLEGDPHQIGVGLGCNGRITVLFSPLDFHDKWNEVELLSRIINTRKPVVISKIISSMDDSLLGNIIPLDKVQDLNPSLDAIRNAIINSGANFSLEKRSVVKPMTIDGKEMEVLFEIIKPSIKVIIIGHNYDVYPMITIAKELGWEIVLLGKKSKFLKEAFELVGTILEYSMLDQIEHDDYCAYVLMTHDYNLDKKLLPKISKLKPRYIGMLGPKKRWEKMEKEVALRIDNENLFTPVGLHLGANTPEEIALSISAEILAIFNGLRAASLKEKKGPIHER